jgi:hypothetical protein
MIGLFFPGPEYGALTTQVISDKINSYFSGVVFHKELIGWQDCYKPIYNQASWFRGQAPH